MLEELHAAPDEHDQFLQRAAAGAGNSIRSGRGERDGVDLGSARVSRAGCGVARQQTFSSPCTRAKNRRCFVRDIFQQVRDGVTPSPTRETRVLPNPNYSACDRELQKFINLLRAVDAHDALPQLFAFLFADHAAAERIEFYGDFLFGHGVARVPFGNVNTRGM